ncbi:MAG: DEAD/DEAH box helicase [Planctomycetes bacterium]|nr:DEAD/DEAH box helicase [Planctomycetota bacterium]
MAIRGLFVGIDRYAHPQANWLHCAARDATALHALFTDTLGEGAQLLTDRQATRSAIEAQLQSLGQCSASDLVVIAFSCHGTADHHLATYDTDPTDLATTAIPLSLLGAWFAGIPARRLLCVIDACFSGGIGAKVFIPAAAAGPLPGNPFDQLSGEGRLVLTAASASEPAWEIGRFSHGLLTFHLLEALRGAEGVREAGKISIYRLLDYVTKRVIDRSAQLGRPQHPTLRGHFDGELTWPVFRPGPTYFAAFPERARKPVTADIMSLESYGFPPELLRAWAGTIPTLNQLQIDAVNDYGLLKGEHLVVSAPTSSGKTMIGELAALLGTTDRKRAFFLLPLKALVNDKQRHFAATYQEFGLRVLRVTGDNSTDVPAVLRGQYDLCLLTYEAFASLLIGNPHILEQVGTVVVDEVQMVANPSRGANLEFVLTLLRMRRRAGVEPQLIALSAVIGDTNGLERWLGARLLRRTERPVPLDEGIMRADGRFRYVDASGAEQLTEPIISRVFRKGSSQDLVIPLVRKLVGEGKQVIVFRETKGDARGCAGYLAETLGLPSATAALAALPSADPSLASSELRDALRHGVAFHTTDLDRDERLAVEEHFRTPGTGLRVIAATTTLAMGVNTPAEAVVVAGLDHPDGPYTVAEYKNIIGRAGRLGYAELGTSYVIALDAKQDNYYWNRYVTGVPEDLRSRFIAEDTDPRTLILRVLAAARRSGVKGVPRGDIIDFLEGSFGAFQSKHNAANWNWDRQQIAGALAELASHRLVEATGDENYHMTPLGRFAGRAGIEVDSILRLVEALAPLAAEQVTDPALIAAAQLTVELDQQGFPINKKGAQQEAQSWFTELRRQNIPVQVLNSLHRSVAEPHVPALRAKKAAACLLWISDRTMADIETILTRHGRKFDGATGAVRGAASRTGDLLPAAAQVATILHPDLDLGNRLTRLLTRLEVGVPAAAVEVAQFAGPRLSRGDYHKLVRAGLGTASAVEGAADETLAACLGGNDERVEIVRDAARLFREQGPGATLPEFPGYEG